MAFEEALGIAETVSSQTPGQRLSRNDVHFPLTTPRKRNPSIPLLPHAAAEDGQSSNGIPRLRTAPIPETPAQDSGGALHSGLQTRTQDLENEACDEHEEVRLATMRDLPEELKNRILDYIFGDMRPVNAVSSSMGLSHRMRHPRRKAVSELALISPDMRVMVQERVYRHIKIPGTKAGLRESQEWFQEHPRLAQYVRHIEYWVPVWGDKAAVLNTVIQQYGARGLANDFGEAAHDFPGIQFKLSTYSASLSQIFDHLGNLFPASSIFTLEGGHCKNSNMIKHFNANLFGKYLNNRLRILPNIKTFVMRGAWNIMRSHEDWNNIQEALPCLTAWHCTYAKPRFEAYNTISEILLQLPNQLRQVEITLDSMFSKDDTVLGSSPDKRGHHICEQLGRIAPKLESLSYTGKVCECFWSAALEALEHDKTKPCSLRSVNIVVKSCCRQRVKNRDAVTGDILIEEVGGIMADGAGIGNLIFINAFERLVMGALDGLAAMPSLSTIKIRYIDLDSPCQQLNPYWHAEKNSVTGIWNDRIVEKLADTRPNLQYDKLEDGIGGENSTETAKREDDVFSWHTQNGLVGAVIPTGVNALYPRTTPKSINTSSYKIISEARAS